MNPHRSTHKITQEIRYSVSYGRIFLRSILIGILCGIVCAFAGCAFLSITNRSFQLHQKYPVLLFLLPAAGLLIAFLYQKAGLQEDKGTNLVIESIRSQQIVPLRSGILIFLSTALTHLCGGSSGREGACLQIGASIGHSLGRCFHLNEKDMHLITLCGMSGMFTALLGTPITACLFSMEVISVGAIYHFAFIPCLMTSLIVFLIRDAFGFVPELYILEQVPVLTPLLILQIFVLAIGCALVAILLCFSMHRVGRFFKTRFENPYLRILLGSCIIIILNLLVGTMDYRGTGLNVAFRALEGSAKPEAFLLKILFTAITLGCGFKGGEIVPTFFIGATFGNVFGTLLGIDPGFGAALGMVGLFCGVVNCPIASLLLSIELFGAEGLVYFSLVCGTCFVLSGYSGLYSSQTILYSKLKAKFINKKAV